MKYCLVLAHRYFSDFINMYNADYTKQDESFTYCVNRERYQELEAFKKLGRVVIYLYSTNTFHNTKGDQIDLNKDWVYIYRGTAVLTPNVINALLDEKVTVFQSKQEIESITNWASILPEEIIKRKIEVYKVIDLEYSENFNNIINKFVKKRTDKFHIKTVSKHWSMVTSLKEWFDDGIGEYKLCYGLEDYKIQISEYKDLKRDNHGTIEFRAFVIDNKIKGISRYTDYEDPKEYKDEAIGYTKEIISKVKNYLPSSYALDVGLTTSGEWIIIEFNSLESSGRYAGIPPLFVKGEL